MKYVLGVDPGLTGGLAVVNPLTGYLVSTFTMPSKKRGNRSDLDLGELAMIIDGLARDIKCAVIEDTAAMPKQGVASMYTFGKVTGIVVGMIAAHYIPIYYVKPSVWKFQMGLGKDKKTSIKKANDFHPGSVQIKHDGVAEAILLAHFGKRFFNV